MKKIVFISLIVLLLLAIIYIVIQRKKQASLAVTNVSPVIKFTGSVSKPAAIVVVPPVQAPSDVTGASSSSSPTASQLAMAAAAKRACEIKCDAKYPFNATNRRNCKASC